MRKIIMVLFMLAAFQPAFAQKADFNKMSAFVRSAVISQPQRMKRAKALSTSSPVLTAFVRIRKNADSIFRQYHCQKLAQFDDIYIASIPLTTLGSLSLHPDVSRIEANRMASIAVDTTRTLLNATPVYPGADLAPDLPHGFTGKGVVVGVQDIGFDLTHPNFYSRDMSRYRIKALWDQLSTDTLSTTLPAGRDYVGEEELLKIQHPYDGLIQTHGTHTAGIAAGSGSEGYQQSPYWGLAPDADLCLVNNVTTDDKAILDSANFYKYTYALDALGFKYIFDYADSQGMPCVINFSEGDRQDFRGDDQLYNEMLGKITGPGHIIVASAGNSSMVINYLHKPVGKERAGNFMYSNSNDLLYTLKSHDPFTIRNTYYVGDTQIQIDIPTAKILTAKDSLYTDTLLVADKHYAYAIQAYPSCYDPQETVYDFHFTSMDTKLIEQYPTLISFEILGRDADVELYLISGYLISRSKYPQLADGEHHHSVYAPGSYPSVICVGATGYRTGFTNYLGEYKSFADGSNGTITSYSGLGPTFDGRTKPDVVAPGQNIISSFSSFYIANPDVPQYMVDKDTRHFEYNGRTYAWNGYSGTSMAAPFVAGTIALWLQANPRLTKDDILQIFAQTCTHPDPSLTYPNNTYGYGQIDVARGLKMALTMTSASIQEHPSVTPSTDLYNLKGQRVDASYQGLTISRQGQKIIRMVK